MSEKMLHLGGVQYDIHSIASVRGFLNLDIPAFFIRDTCIDIERKAGVLIPRGVGHTHGRKGTYTAIV